MWRQLEDVLGTVGEGQGNWLNIAVRTDDVNSVGRLCARDTNQEVVRLDIAVDEGLLVNGLNASDLHHKL